LNIAKSALGRTEEDEDGRDEVEAEFEKGKEQRELTNEHKTKQNNWFGGTQT
jgi:hypothetical protein